MTSPMVLEILIIVAGGVNILNGIRRKGLETAVSSNNVKISPDKKRIIRHYLNAGQDSRLETSTSVCLLLVWAFVAGCLVFVFDAPSRPLLSPQIFAAILLWYLPDIAKKLHHRKKNSP